MTTGDNGNLFALIPNDAEESLAGAMLTSSEVVDRVSMAVGRDDFGRPELGTIFEALVSMRECGLPLDPVADKGELIRLGHWGETGINNVTLVELMAGGFEHANAEYYAGIVRAMSARRRLLRLAGDTRRAVLDDPSADVAALVADLTERAGQIGNGIADDGDGLLDSAGLDAADLRHKWLVPGLLVRNQPAIIGGPQKSLKTCLAVDLALSLGMGQPFLSRFPTLRRTRVMLLSGESGAATIRETARRIAASHEMALADADVLWGFDLPKLGDSGDVAALKRTIERREVEVVIIDPAYLCMMSGDAEGRSAANLFDMGSLLSPLSRVGQDTGATVILVHHLRLHRSSGPGEPATLEDLAFAGFQEWARQWLLVTRQKAYEPGSGWHELWLSAGGSAGHGGLYSVTVDEGKQGEDFTGRTWKVSVEEPHEARERAKASKDEAKAVKDEQRVTAALELYPDGETRRVIREAAGMSAGAFNPTLDAMTRRGAVVATTIKKNTRSEPAFKLPSEGND